MYEEIEEILKDLFKDENVNGFILSDERYKELKDYITNLQQENENTKKLKERYQLEKEIYKSRCEKAIEYINENYPTSTINYQDDKYKLINILNGSDEE